MFCGLFGAPFTIWNSQRYLVERRDKSLNRERVIRNMWSGLTVGGFTASGKFQRLSETINHYSQSNGFRAVGDPPVTARDLQSSGERPMSVISVEKSMALAVPSHRHYPGLHCTF